jgi:hypothetical protein
MALLALTGCDGDRRALPADSWYSPPPSQAGFAPLDEDRFAPVAADLQAEAQAALAEMPAKRITAAEGARLVGRPLPADGEVVLLRAVVQFENTGRFEVGVRGSAVHVLHMCLGRGPVAMGRKALVAVLPTVPKSVFVSCIMGE